MIHNLVSKKIRLQKFSTETRSLTLTPLVLELVQFVLLDSLRPQGGKAVAALGLSKDQILHGTRWFALFSLIARHSLAKTQTELGFAAR